MILYYYRDPVGNFGDDLNPWLWPQLVPGIFDQDDGFLFLGIGTVLNHRVPVLPMKVVLGTGFGYGKAPELDHRWKIYSVRGPLSAMALRLDPSLAITDPAVLIRTLDLPKESERYALSFLPHHLSAKRANWKLFCRMAGIHYIEPRANLFEIIRNIQRSKLVVAESMHGAIVADALRVPWVPIRIYEYINEFKWNDWCKSMALSYRPIPLKHVIDQDLSLRGKMRRKLMPVVIAAGLRQLAGSVEPSLSTDAVLDTAISRLQEKVEQFKHDFMSRRLYS